VIDLRSLLFWSAAPKSSAQGLVPLVSFGKPGSPDRAFKLIWARLRASVWRRQLALGAIGLSALVLGAALAFANWYMAQDERLGVVHFPTSCGWQSQREFITATALLHLFRFAEAEEQPSRTTSTATMR
jgi:hypothetical protein